MPAQLTQFDREICGSRNLRVLIRRPTRDPSRTEARAIQFQFPPKVTNDSRDGEWEEKSAGPNSGDKIAVYKSANPRRITLEWTYIVGFAGWTIDDIKTELKTMRGYFRNPFIENIEGDDAGARAEQANSPLVINLLLWDIGGDEPMSFRMSSASCKHGPTLVNGRSINEPGIGRVFPLKTEVSAEFKSWPSIGDPPAQTVPGQKPFTVDWF